MKKLSLFAFLIILLQASGRARAQQWIRTLDGGAHGTDEALAVAATSDSGVFVGGQMDMGSYRCGALARYSASGDLLRLTRYDPYPGYESLVSHVAASEAGNLYATAACNDSADTQTTAVLRLSADGALLHEYRYSHPDHLRDYPCGLLLDRQGGVLVLVSSRTNTTDYDVLVVKCDTTCQPIWQTRYDLSGGLNRPHAMSSDSSGGVFVVGHGIANSVTVGTVMKIAANGDTIWTRIEGTPGEATEFESVAVGDESVYAVGFRSFGRARVLTIRYTGSGDTVWTRERIECAPKAAVAVDTLGIIHAGVAEDSSTSADIKTTAYTTSGNLKWVRRYDGPAHIYDYPTAVVADPARDAMYVTGYSQGIGTGWDCTTISYDLSGNLRWLDRFVGEGGHGHDGAQAMALDGAGNVIVAGYQTAARSGRDWLVIKYPPSGPGIGEVTGREMHPSDPGIRVSPSIARGVCSMTIQNAPECNELCVYDACGGLVRRIPILLSPSHPNHVEWHLDDTRGGLVPNGVYFVTIDEPSCQTGTKVVVQR